MCKKYNILNAAAYVLMAAPLAAQSNAEAELVMIGDVIAGPLTAEVDGTPAGSMTYLIPSLGLTGSNYLISLSGDPNDFLTVGLDLATGGTYFNTPADGSGHTTFPLALPNNSGLLDVPVYFQAFAATSATTFEKFSNTATVSVNTANRWQSLNPAPVASANLGFVVSSYDAQGLPKTVFTCGGGPYLLTDELTPYPTINQAWSYDVAKEKFTLLGGTMAQSRAFHNAVLLLDGRIMAIGGVIGPFGTGPYYTKVLSSVEIYDPATDSWTNGAPMSQFRAGCTANVLPDGRVLVAGGTKGGANRELYSVDDIMTTSLRTTEIYDPVSDTWSAGPSMSMPKAGGVSIALDNDEIMIAGGITYTSIFGIKIPDFANDVQFYNPSTNSFRNKNMNEKRALFGITKMNNGKVLLSGGAGGDIFSIGPIVKQEVYNPATNSFSGAPPLTRAVAFSTTVALADGRAMVVGGARGDLDDPIPVENVWIYDPFANTTTEVASMNATHGGHVAVYTGAGNVTVFCGESDSGGSEATAESYSF
ncbi:MAG: hypothetical protein HQ519_10175 [Planctomycetes bacterium]|nr:hypothetical protein [Planctomycetota bacterium]